MSYSHIPDVPAQMIKGLNIIRGFIKLSLQEIGMSGEPSEQATKRMETCIACPLGGGQEIESWNKFCKSCGCFMPAKVLVDKEVCPEGKW